MFSTICHPLIVLFTMITVNVLAFFSFIKRNVDVKYYRANTSSAISVISKLAPKVYTSLYISTLNFSESIIS